MRRHPTSVFPGSTRGCLLVALVTCLVLVPGGPVAAHGGAPAWPTGPAAAAIHPAGVRPASGGPSYVPGATTLASISVYSQPTIATFDPADNDLYVQNFGAPLLHGNTESIVNDTNNTVIATVNVGDDPLSSVYDAATADVYVMNFGTSNNVTVFHGTSIVDWIPTGVTPIGAVYDPSNEYVYVVDQGSNNLTVLNGTTTVGSVPLGSYPGTAALDTQSHWLYVPNAASNNVTVVNGSAGAGLATIGSVNVGTGPIEAVYDPSNGWVYVPNPGSGTVTVLNGTSVVATVRTGAQTPEDGCADPTNGWVYITDLGSNSVTVLNGTAVVGNVSTGVFPRGPVFDPADGFVYVPGWTTNDLTVINGTTAVATVAVGSNPYGAVYDPHAAAVVVSNFNANNLSKVGTPNPSVRVTFHETGLPAGTPWTVDWNATSYPTNDSGVVFPSGPGTFNYTLGSVPSYSASPANGRVTVSASAMTVNVTFQAAYPVTFTETGLVNGTFWSVTIDPVTNGTGTTALQLWEPNGSYAYTVAPLAGYTTTWRGTVPVAGAAANVTVVFAVPTYPVWFNETGLPLGTLWGASLGSYGNTTTNASLLLSAPNGTYRYSLDAVPGFLGDPAAGRVTVAGTFVNVRITFVAAFSVVFEETGLPAGTNWTVTLGSGPESTTQANLTVVRANGTYAYSVATSNFNYVPGSTHGSFNVTGMPGTVPVAFEPRRASSSSFWLNFTESGLPSGTEWSVTLGNATNASTTGTIGFLIGNATYSFNVSATGYLPSPPGGLVVANGPASVATPVAIAFVAESTRAQARFAIDFTGDGLPSPVAWTVAIGNSTDSGAGHPLSLDEPNGTYTYSIAPVSGYVSNASGSVTVDGATVPVFVVFRPFESRVEFREVGLPAGTSWNVTLGASDNATAVSVLSFQVPNGSYAYSIGAVAGFVTPAGGTVEVNGTGPAIVQVAYVRTTTGPSLVFGFPPYEAIGVAVAIAAVGLLLAVLVPVGRRPTGEASEQPEAGGADSEDDGTDEDLGPPAE